MATTNLGSYAMVLAQAKVQAQIMAQRAQQTIFYNGVQFGGTGLWGGSLSSSPATGNFSEMRFVPPDYPPGKDIASMKTTFFRVNDKVSVNAWEEVKGLEPLDELRIKVAKWIYN